MHENEKQDRRPEFQTNITLFDASAELTLLHWRSLSCIAQGVSKSKEIGKQIRLENLHSQLYMHKIVLIQKIKAIGFSNPVIICDHLE